MALSNVLEFGPTGVLDLAAVAAQSPLGVGHLADGALPGEAPRLEMPGEFVENALVDSGVVAGAEDGAVAEAVPEVVLW
jgi:hypothetical protein